MADLYAKIDMTYNPGVVVNTQLIDKGDALDPAFTWVDIANVSPQPHAGWAYNGKNFTNVICAPYLSSIPASVVTGQATTFAPFTLSAGSSGFTVSLDGTIVNVGCKSYDYTWLRYAFDQIMNQGVAQIGPLAQTPTGISQDGQFNILQADVNLINAALQTLVDLGTMPFPPVYNKTTTTQQQVQAVITAAATFGNSLMVEYAAQNVLAGITQAGQTQAVLTYTATLEQCLVTGSLYAAISAIQAMINDSSATKTNLAPFVTNDILYNYLNQIQTYMGLPLTPNPGP